MERHKSRFLQDFLSRDGSRSLEHYRNKVKMMEQMLRDDYETKFDLTSDQFVDMMILDGCFILELLIKIYNHTPDEIFKNESLLQYIKIDLLMIENQVPLLVLEILHGNPRNYKGPIPTINQLLAYYFWDIKNALWRYEGCSHHSLLHSYYQFFIFPSLGDKRSILAEPKERKSTKFGVVVHSSPSIPSAQELEKVGVVFKAKKTIDFLDITFHEKVLEMPVMSVDEQFLLLFINLVMFEIVSGRDDIMKGYCYFMRYLLRYPGDVAVLRKHGIIKSHLMTDESLTYLFSRLNLQFELCGAQPLYFMGLMEDLRQFRDRAKTTWHDIQGYYAERIMHIIEVLWFSLSAVLILFIFPIFCVVGVIICIVAFIKK
ncbi:UPF0481 protein At3g47200-like [Carex rostrata]